MLYYIYEFEAKKVVGYNLIQCLQNAFKNTPLLELMRKTFYFKPMQ